jgi:hypothetical protein
MLMKRVWGHVLTGLTLLGIGGAGFAACVHNDSTIFIQDVLAPQQVSNGQACVYTSATTQAVISSGRLDIDFSYEYQPWFLVGNQMVAEANSAQLVTETSTVTLQGAVVRITDAQGNQLTTFTRLAAGTVYPAVGGVPGYAPISVTTIDIGTTSALCGGISATNQCAGTGTAAKILNAHGSVRLVTYTRFFGNTLGGKYVESDEFEFPVDVCKGCLISFTPQDIRTAPLCNGCPLPPIPNCLGNGALGTSSAQQSLPCAPGQDLPIDCLQCQAVPDCQGACQNGACNYVVADAGGGG